MSDSPSPSSARLVFLDADTMGYMPGMEAALGQFGQVTLYGVTHPGDVATRLQDADIAITNKVVLDRYVLEKCPKLRLICVAATGTNNIDLEFAASGNIAVKNVKGYSTASVVQLTYTFIFHLLTHVAYFDRYVKSGEYVHSPVFTHHGKVITELEGKTIGIIGLGEIGRKVAETGKAFGAEILYYSTSGKNTQIDFERTGLNDLLRRADIVTIHAPLNEATKGLIGLSQFEMMKPTSMLINTGRGGIIEESALAYALDHGIIAGAATDVYATEPVAQTNPLLTLKNKDKILLTPHIAWAGAASREKLLQGICDNIRHFLDDYVQLKVFP